MKYALLLIGMIVFASCKKEPAEKTLDPNFEAEASFVDMTGYNSHGVVLIPGWRVYFKSVSGSSENATISFQEDDIILPGSIIADGPWTLTGLIVENPYAPNTITIEFKDYATKEDTRGAKRVVLRSSSATKWGWGARDEAEKEKFKANPALFNAEIKTSIGNFQTRTLYAYIREE